jgi:hypothetical protein
MDEAVPTQERHCPLQVRRASKRTYFYGFKVHMTVAS